MAHEIIPGSMEKLLQTLRAADHLEPRFVLAGLEIKKDIRRRSRNLLAELAHRIVDEDLPPTIVIEAVRTVMVLRYELRQPGDDL